MRWQLQNYYGGDIVDEVLLIAIFIILEIQAKLMYLVKMACVERRLHMSKQQPTMLTFPYTQVPQLGVPWLEPRLGLVPVLPVSLGLTLAWVWPFMAPWSVTPEALGARQSRSQGWCSILLFLLLVSFPF